MTEYKENKYLSQEDIAAIEKRYFASNYSTHYEGCWKDHHACMVDKLMQVIKKLNDDLNTATAYDYRSYAPDLWLGSQEDKDIYLP